MKGSDNKMVVNADMMVIISQAWFSKVYLSGNVPHIEKVTHDNRTGLFHLHFRDEDAHISMIAAKIAKTSGDNKP